MIAIQTMDNPWVEAFNTIKNDLTGLTQATDVLPQNPWLAAQGRSTPYAPAQPKLTGQVWPDFVTVAKPLAQKANFPLNVLLGQAALESARGKSAPGNNYFGIKATPGQSSTNQNTQEYGGGGYYSENDAFAAYPTPQDNIQAYLNLVTSYPGVKEAMATNNPDAVLRAIEANGYATSPTYVQDVEATPEFRGEY